MTGIVGGDGVLSFTWAYSAGLHHAATVERLARDFTAELRSLVRHCAQPAAGGRTPRTSRWPGSTRPGWTRWPGPARRPPPSRTSIRSPRSRTACCCTPRRPRGLPRPGDVPPGGRR
ncbi:hypothetical protein ACFQVA_17250 [Actinomadura keratinilytica]